MGVTNFVGWVGKIGFEFPKYAAFYEANVDSGNRHQAHSPAIWLVRFKHINLFITFKIDFVDYII